MTFRGAVSVLLVACLLVFGAVKAWPHVFGSGSVTGSVRHYTGDGYASCDKAGIMAFAGGSQSVYDCRYIRNGTGYDRCFVKAKGGLYDVTRQIREARSFDADARTFACAG